jgi:YjbE family integral membrane protein
MTAGSHWSELLQGISGNLEDPALWLAVPQIILINVLFSGDNAVVIAMACRGLPPRQRFWGTVIGAMVSATLLVSFAAVVTVLMGLPYLKVAGGLVLFYIAVNLMLPAGETEGEVEASTNLWRAVRTIFVADFIMSLDNIIAVAAVAEGNLSLIAISLAISIPVILAGATLIMRLLDRFPILIWLGAGLLGWVAGETIATDLEVTRFLTRAFGEAVLRPVELASAAAGFVLVIVVGGLWRRMRQLKVPASPGGPAADA